MALTASGAKLGWPARGGWARRWHGGGGTQRGVGAGGGGNLLEESQSSVHLLRHRLHLILTRDPYSAHGFRHVAAHPCVHVHAHCGRGSLRTLYMRLLRLPLLCLTQSPRHLIQLFLRSTLCGERLPHSRVLFSAAACRCTNMARWAERGQDGATDWRTLPQWCAEDCDGSQRLVGDACVGDASVGDACRLHAGGQHGPFGEACGTSRYTRCCPIRPRQRCQRVHPPARADVF